MHLIGVIVIGFVAGLVAKLLTSDRSAGGFIMTTLLGIVGSLLATWLGQSIGWYGPGQGAGFIGSIVGAVIILALHHGLTGRRLR
jgi:uncharacterized membrane protein YeaQ/YmgE (transglycosylase-associated protein family)